jgi:hypothetical protein
MHCLQKRKAGGGDCPHSLYANDLGPSEGPQRRALEALHPGPDWWLFHQASASITTQQTFTEPWSQASWSARSRGNQQGEAPAFYMVHCGVSMDKHIVRAGDWRYLS